MDRTGFWLRAPLWALFAWWGIVLVKLDVRTGEMGEAFLHRPLLVFHEAGHVLFMPFGEWLTVAGGTLGQLLMPLVMAGALGWKNRDAFGASLGLWLFGVSILDVAPYMYDAFDPQLILLGGHTGEDGPHDWIYLFRSAGKLMRAQQIGLATHRIGAVVVVLSLLWGAILLARRWLRGDEEEDHSSFSPGS